MSKGPMNFKGAPKSQQDYDPVLLFRNCGGSGGGGCVLPIGLTHVIWAYRVPKFITYNRKIIFDNPEFLGVRIYNDAGSNGFCPNTIGTEQTFWVGLGVSSSLDPETTAKKGVELSGVLPYQIEFQADKIPQPTDPLYVNIIYVYVWWGDAGFINENAAITNERPAFDLVKHDYDIKI